jgi:hypothetical protein|tara:strand:- start:467 stop:1057 length:591 start_codon:yes stop_codon:yes gene_type:complete
MGLFRNLTKTIGKLAPIAIPAMIGFGVGGGSMAGIGSLFKDMSFGQKAMLGLGGIGALGAAMGSQEREVSFEPRPDPVGKNFAMTGRLRDGSIVQLNNPDELQKYRKEIQTRPNPNDYIVPVSDINLTGDKVGIASMMHGGEVHGPGTGTSDSVPARLSDGEFVMTAAAVRGAGGGDRDIGAARMYDMMAELEAQA